MTASESTALPGRLKDGLASAARSTSRLLARAADSVLVDSEPDGTQSVEYATASGDSTLQIDLLFEHVESVRASVDQRVSELAQIVYGLRELVQALTSSDLAHQHQLVQIDDRLARVTSVDDLRQLSEHWLRQKGITKVIEPDDQSHWKVNGGSWEDRNRYQVIRPAYLGPGPNGSSVVLQYGELAPLPASAPSSSAGSPNATQPATTHPEAPAP